jgi:hypothetical protein
VILSNGDQLEGFVNRVGQTIGVEVDGKTIENGVRQVASIEFANPVKQPTGTRVWLVDGSVINLESVRIEERAGTSPVIRLELARGTWGLPPSPPAPPESPSADPSQRRPAPATRVERPKDGGAILSSIKPLQIVAIAPEVSRLTALSALELTSVRRVGDALPTALDPVSFLRDGSAGAASPAGVEPFQAESFQIAGPVSTEWKLPAGAVRLAGRAELPRDCLAWGDCVLVMAVGPEQTSPNSPPDRFRELLREPLNGNRSFAAFNLALAEPGSAGAAGGVGGTPMTLRITIEPGANGPIQDHVVLSRALIQRSTPASGKR